MSAKEKTWMKNIAENSASAQTSAVPDGTTGTAYEDCMFFFFIKCSRVSLMKNAIPKSVWRPRTVHLWPVSVQ